MSGVKVKDGSLAKFNESVQGWFSAVRESAEAAAVGLAHEAFEQIIETAPQGSGDFVANTNVSVSHPVYEFFENPVGNRNSASAGRGDEQAMNRARSKADWSSIRSGMILGESVFISSKAKHDQYYSVLIEEGKINLRPVNQGADHIYRKARNYVANHYGQLDRAKLAVLRNKVK